MGIDKHRASNHKWRISEKFLITLAILGASAGSILGMGVFHHKTKHPKFYIGLPVIFFLQIAAVLVLSFKLQ